MEKSLTNETEYVLCALYDEYRRRRKNGVPPDEARLFGSPENIQENYIKDCTTDEIDAAAKELHDRGFANCCIGDERCVFLVLETDGIIFMERRFGDKLGQLAEHISSLRKLLPFSRL